MSTQREQPPVDLRAAGDRENPTRKVLRRYIWRRCVHQNEHFMGCIVGREGSGKSYAALRIASAVDPSFDASRVFFQPKNLLEAFKDSDLGAGDMIILDEAGVSMGRRTWYEKDQVLLNQTLQTVRDENMGCLFTLPRLSELDSQAVGRLHAFIEMIGIDHEADISTAKWKNVDQARDESGKVYKKYPRMRVNGRVKKIKQVAFTEPVEALVEQYEARKEAFKDELYEQAIAAQEQQEAEQEAGQTPKEIADEILDAGDIEAYVSEHSQNKTRYIDADLLRAEYGLSIRDAKTVKKQLEKAATIEE